tara:strand:- start:551 stop:688 length:138 start_codon:yes stop_codon:yes gene_type:complete
LLLAVVVLEGKVNLMVLLAVVLEDIELLCQRHLVDLELLQNLKFL